MLQTVTVYGSLLIYMWTMAYHHGTYLENAPMKSNPTGTSLVDMFGLSGENLSKKSTTFIVKLDKQNKVLAFAQLNSKHDNDEVNRGDCMCIDSPKNLEQNK